MPGRLHKCVLDPNKRQLVVCLLSNVSVVLPNTSSQRRIGTPFSKPCSLFAWAGLNRELTVAPVFLSAYNFGCDGSKPWGTGTMFCRSLYPATATMQWVTSTYTQFGPSVESVAVYVATLRVEDQGTRSHTVVTASGPVIASDLRGPDSVLWAMAVLITYTVSFVHQSRQLAVLPVCASFRGDVSC